MLANKFASLLILFSEPGFPRVDVADLPRIDGAIEARSVAELRDALKPGRVLVWRHGSAFPAEAWGDIERFLDAGGSMLYLGGEPFTRPDVGEPGKRRVEPRTVSYLKALRLNQCYRVDVGAGRLKWLDPDGGGAPGETSLPKDAWAAVLEPRLCDTKDFADEDGSPGSRDAAVTPLALAWRQDDDPRFPSAAAALAVEQLRGRWAGGRWVFWLASTPPSHAELSHLIDEVSKRPVEFHVDPTFGCFHEGERPSVILRLHRPRAVDAIAFDVTLTITSPSGEHRDVAGLLAGTTHATARIALPINPLPGLYRVRARAQGLPTVETGFWMFDPALFTSGDTLTFDAYTLRRAGKPEPVVGTTLMSATVQRKFLFEPNAAVWDDAFADLAAMKINMVRTGVWSAWRKIALDPGVVDEAWLRALEAYYLGARKHGIPVIFNFFAFLPETWGGANPYLDPRAIEAQRAYVAAVASRFGDAKEIMWDLINEPSFSSAKHLWQCRPSGDAFERAAFLEWLKQQYGAAGEDWQLVVRRRWRLTATEPIGLPTNEDFEDGTVFGNRRPYRAADYVLFAQDAFADWARTMTDAIRAAGSKAAITVGQDEGGLTQRPGPLLHHPAVDFTSMHTWWLNDSLLTDGVGAKARGKPLLISETGVMQRELLSGEALRPPEESARLLSRKIGYAFASRAFGVLEWCYDVNPFMASDNEVAIGLRRVDGGYKPEHRVLREFAAFVARNKAHFAGLDEPEVAVIVPDAELFSPRDAASDAVRRCVDAMEAGLGVHVQLVPDRRASADLGKPRAIVLPACRGVSESTWQAIRGAMNTGATLLCTGWFEADDASLPATRLGLLKRPLALRETRSDGATLRFPRGINDSWYAADGLPGAAWIEKDGLRVWRHPLPLEWTDSPATLRAFYAAGLERAGVRLPPKGSHAPEGLFVSRLRFRDAMLVIAINETAADAKCRLCPGAREMAVPAGEARMALLDAAEKKVIDRQEGR